MNELLEDTPILIVSTNRERALPLENKKQFLATDTSQKKVLIKKDKSEEEITRPANWIMPPQPEAYLKYPRYDFL